MIGRVGAHVSVMDGSQLIDSSSDDYFGGNLSSTPYAVAQWRDESLFASAFGEGQPITVKLSDSRSAALYVGEDARCSVAGCSQAYASNNTEVAPPALPVGGRATLIGPIVGAFLVNGAKSWLTVAYPEFWLYFLGALFIVVTLFLPQGVIGLVRRLRGQQP